jgi:hypothetical protein
MGTDSYVSNLVLSILARYQDSDSNIYVAHSTSQPKEKCTITWNP